MNSQIIEARQENVRTFYSRHGRAKKTHFSLCEGVKSPFDVCVYSRGVLSLVFFEWALGELGSDQVNQLIF